MVAVSLAPSPVQKPGGVPPKGDEPADQPTRLSFKNFTGIPNYLEFSRQRTVRTIRIRIPAHATSRMPLVPLEPSPTEPIGASLTKKNGHRYDRRYDQLWTRCVSVRCVSHPPAASNSIQSYSTTNHPNPHHHVSRSSSHNHDEFLILTKSKPYASRSCTTITR